MAVMSGALITDIGGRLVDNIDDFAPNLPLIYCRA